jgi:hypothetical protein
MCNSDDMEDSLRKLHDYRERLRSHLASVPPNYVDSIAVLAASTITDKTTLKSNMPAFWWKYEAEIRILISFGIHLRALLIELCHLETSCLP